MLYAQIGTVGGVNRRMVGHGNLAEKAILPVMPSRKEFPYMTRITRFAHSLHMHNTLCSSGCTLRFVMAICKVIAVVI
jgi:hypothetical protein